MRIPYRNKNFRCSTASPQSDTAAPAPIAPGPITLAELHGWTLLVAGLAYWGNVVRGSREGGAGGPALLLESVLENGAFSAAAWALVAAWAHGAASTGRATGRQIVASVAICLLCAVPIRQAMILALIVLGLWLARPAGTRSGRPVAALLLALAIDMAWSSAYLLPLHAAIATLDARAVEGMLGLGGIEAGVHANLIDNRTSGFSLEILANCASSFPLGGVGLAFVVTALYQGRLPRRGDLRWIAASLGASIVLTEIRLSWMASREASYVWLHDGDGVTLYTLSALGLAVLFPLLATRNAAVARVVS